MSELRFWSLRLLFVWQLLWLLVQAAPIQRVALDPSLLTSVPTRPTEPWLSDQQVPPRNIYDDSESSLYVSEASVPTMEFLGQMESSATKEDIPTKGWNEMVNPPSQPGTTAEDPEEIDLSPFQQETLGQPIAEADATVLQPLSDLPEDSEVTHPNAEPVQAQKQTSDITLPPLDLALTVTPNPTVEDHATAVMPPTAPPKHPEVTFPQPGPVQAQQQTLSDITLPPLDQELTITPELTVEEFPTVLIPPTAPPEHSGMTFPHLEPVQAQQQTTSDITLPPLDLELTIAPNPSVEEHPTAVTPPTTLPTYPKVTFPHQEPVQTQPPTLSEVTVPHPDLELTITPKQAKEAELPVDLQIPTAPPRQPEVTFPHPAPIQGQPPTLPEVTVPHPDLELTITPKQAEEAELPVDLQIPTAPPKHPEVTFPHPAPVQGQPPTLPEVTVPHPDLELTITPKQAEEAELPVDLQIPTAPPRQPEVTFPHPAPVQGQPPTLPEVTVPHPDLELTITPKQAEEAELPVDLQIPTAPPKHPEVTFPHPAPVQGQPPTLPEVTVPHPDLELTITPKQAEEAELPVDLQIPTAPPRQPEVTFPYPAPVQGQPPTLPEVTVPHPDLELTITPEPIVETEHPTAPQLSTAPPKHPEGTVLVQVQQPTQGEVQVSDVRLFRMQQPEISKAGPPTTEQKLPMDICELCACYGSTLSCTGLSPEQKLRSVPVLYPNIYNHTFTIVNLQGNAISHIDKNTWKSYHSLEKLILSENNLKELHKDSFEGLLSLQYLDLSSNNIQHIERNTFDSIPFLQHLNLQNNLMTKVSFGTFQAWHGIQFLHHLILSHNPLTTVEDPYLFKLQGLQYLDMGTTQVLLTTVERILMMTLNLENLILPSHLVCCLCQFKKNIEAVSKTVKLNCDSDCLTNTHCDEELHLERTGGSFMKILQGRKENNCPQLTVEPEGASSGESGDSLAALTNILKDLLSEQEAVKVSKVDWDTGGWKRGTTEAQGEQNEESRKLTQEVPGYRYKNNLTLAPPVIVLASFFILFFLFIVMCHKSPSEECKEEGDFSSTGYERSLEEDGSWSRRPLSLWERLWPFNIICNRNEEQNLHLKDEGPPFIHIEKGEDSLSTTEGATSDSAGEETSEENEP